MKIAAYLSLSLFLAMPFPAQGKGSVSTQEVQVIANTMKYVIGLPQTNKQVEILALYDPELDASNTEANLFAQQVNESKTAKKQGLTATLGTLQDIPSTSARLLFVPNGFSAHYIDIARLASTHHLLPISTDKSCVAAKSCALSFSIGDSIEIYLSEDALKASGFDVDAAFRFMVRLI